MALESLIASAEASLIGAVLIEPKIVGEMMMRVHPEDYADDELRHIYQAIRSVWSEGGNIDAVTVCAAAGSDKQPIIARCMMDTPTAASWEEYAEIVSKAARLRRIQTAAGRVSVAATLEDAEAAVEEINRNMAERDRAEITGFLEGIQNLYISLMQQNKQKYLKWGIRQLDAQLYVGSGDFVIIAGAASAGKTMLATQFALELAKECRVGFFSLETSSQKIYARAVAQLGQVPFGAIKRGELSKQQWKDFCQLISNSQQKKLPFDVIRAAGMSVADIRAISAARRYDIVFIDYLQLMSGTGDDGSYERTTAVSIALHTFAQSTGTTVIALSQLSRPEKGSKRRPRLSDLRGSGQIEQDADVVMALSLKSNEERSGPRFLDILKNKEGECGCVSLAFDPEHMRLAPMSNRPAPPDRRARSKTEEDEDE